MKQALKRVAGATAVMAAAVAGVAIAPATAEAASYGGQCGAGYSVIDTWTLSGQGTVFLTYSSSTGKNCVVTVRNSPGARVPMDAKISLAGAPWISDPGNFTTYAGPVYVYAPHACIDWGGEINGVAHYELGVHCS